MKVGTKVQMLNDNASVTYPGEFFWRKGDVGIVTDVDSYGAIVDFNGVEGQTALPPGKWWVLPSDMGEVLP